MPLVALALPAVLAILLAGLVLVFALGAGSRDDGTDEGEPTDEDGGSRTPPLRPFPPASPTGADPEWWPEFERDFAQYVALRPRELQTAS